MIQKKRFVKVFFHLKSDMRANIHKGCVCVCVVGDLKRKWGKHCNTFRPSIGFHQTKIYLFMFYINVRGGSEVYAKMSVIIIHREESLKM